MKFAIITLALVLVGLTVPVMASVPKEYQTGTSMHDADVYKVSMEHRGTAWAEDNLYYLTRAYAQHGTIDELKAKMAWLITHEKK